MSGRRGAHGRRREPRVVVARGRTAGLSPAAIRAVGGAVEQLGALGPAGAAPLEIMVRIQHEGAATSMPVPAVGTPIGAGPTSPLEDRLVTAPAALERNLPFRRRIEESRPYVVLGEGIGMIHAHRMARTIFHGGLTFWLAGYVLAGHGVRGPAMAVALLLLLLSWIAAYLTRSGAMRVLLASVRESRSLLAEPTTWARLAGGGPGLRLLARSSRVLFRVPMPDQALIQAATIRLGGRQAPWLERSTDIEPIPLAGVSQEAEG